MFEPMISVVIPVYNRTENLKLTLTALDAQHLAEPIEVVVCDDGSSDRPLEVLQSGPWKFEWAFTSHPRAGVQIARTRNEGAKLARGKNYYFIDSDVLLNPWALDNARKYALELPETIFCGRYDWLPPMRITPFDIRSKWEDVMAARLPPLVMRGGIIGIQGPDPRFISQPRIFTPGMAHPGTDDYRLALFSGNIVIPKEVFWKIGGFDPDIVGHGGEDAEFGIRAFNAKTQVRFLHDTHGYHVYHLRDQERNTREVKANIEYMLAKHNLTVEDFNGIGTPPLNALDKVEVE